MKQIETISNAIESFIGILDRAFKISLLFGGEVGSSNSV